MCLELQLFWTLEVSAHMFFHVAFSVEAAVANEALEGLLASVNPLVAG